jgi:hypothetical protein
MSPSWAVQDVALEELVLAYLGQQVAGTPEPAINRAKGVQV